MHSHLTFHLSSVISGNSSPLWKNSKTFTYLNIWLRTGDKESREAPLETKSWHLREQIYSPLTCATVMESTAHKNCYKPATLALSRTRNNTDPLDRARHRHSLTLRTFWQHGGLPRRLGKTQSGALTSPQPDVAESARLGSDKAASIWQRRLSLRLPSTDSPGSHNYKWWPIS